MAKNIYTCRICGLNINAERALVFKSHIEKVHNLIWEEYLREYHPEFGGYCLECGKETPLDSYVKGFKRFCSKKCGSIYTCNHRDEETKEKIKEKRSHTNIERYGASNCFQSPDKKEKIKQTNLKRYGVENPRSSQEIQDRINKSCLERYGVEHYFQSKDFSDKSRQTTMERYGVEHSLQSKEIKEKVNKTCLEKYGVPWVLQSKEVHEKSKITNLDKYGVEYPGQSKEVQDKAKQTCLERYGVENPNKSDFIKEKIKNTHRSHRYDLFKAQLLQFKNIELLDSKEEYIKNDMHKFCCKKHGDFESKGTKFQSVFCKKCSVQNTTSKLEKEVVNFLSQYVSCETSNRTVLSGKELDILIPEKKLAVEFDGLYWHSNIKREKNYHLEKTEMCEEQNIQLIHIFENEWLNKRPIVESILLAKLSIFQKRLYARKCSVKTVSQEAYREFTELNHLQGYVPAKLILGLFYEDELVEICSFGKSRFKKDEMELLRHCSKLHYQIVGGFSKLISQWKKLNTNEDLYTYCDRRYSNGKSYEASGWEHTSTTTPNYFYISKTGLESRIKYQKHKLSEILSVYDENLTEQENMLNNGYKWIYDCGNLKYKI